MKKLAETIAGWYVVRTFQDSVGYHTIVIDTEADKTIEDVHYKSQAEALDGHNELAHKYIFIHKDEEDFFNRNW